MAKNNDIFNVMASNIKNVNSAAANRAGQSTMAAVKERIRRDYNIKNKDLSDNMSIRKASTQRPYVTMVIRHSPLSLSYFSARQIGAGVSYSIFKGARKVWKSAFFVNLLGGARQVVERYGPKVRMTKGNYKGHMRQRIKKLTGPSIAQTFIGKRGGNMMQYINDTFKDKFLTEFNRLKDRLSGSTQGLD